MIRADAMASDILNNDQDSFWKEVKKLNSCKSIHKTSLGLPNYYLQ